MKYSLCIKLDGKIMRIEFKENNEIIKVYNCGVLLLQEKDYNEIILTIKEALTIIKDDLYQIEVLK